jgi:hypothetical protein
MIYLVVTVLIEAAQLSPPLVSLYSLHTLARLYSKKTTEFSSLAFLLLYGFILPFPITSPNPHPAYMCIMFRNILVLPFLRDGRVFKTVKNKY